MYTLHISATEYPSVWRVSFAFSLVHEDGSVRPFGTKETWIERDDVDRDPLEEALTVVKRAATIELRP